MDHTRTYKLHVEYCYLFIYLFILQQVFEKIREFNLQTHVAFIDFEKAFDKVNRNKLWIIMEEPGYPQHLIRVIQSLYHNSKIIINTGKNKTEEIIVNKGVRQGCSISPTLFNIQDVPKICTFSRLIFRIIMHVHLFGTLCIYKSHHTKMETKY
jgi:hypothetical protein